MFRPKFVFRNEAGDGADGGGAGNLITPSKWGMPDGAEEFVPSSGDGGGEGASALPACRNLTFDAPLPGP